jgi:TPR repeat protein
MKFLNRSIQMQWFLKVLSVLFLLTSLGCQSPSNQTRQLSAWENTLLPIPLRSENLSKAQKGDAEAQYDVGKYYAERSGSLYANYLEASTWLKLSAAQGHEEAKTLLVAIEQHEAEQEGLLEAFKAKAESGVAEAQVTLGMSYLNGNGAAKDYVEAIKWFRKAAEQNNPDGQNDLGVCYHDGYGVAKDYVEAMKWYRLAAEQNVAGAQLNVGSAYYYGQGVPKDTVAAATWYRKAAEQNLPEAQYNLGMSYYEGIGVPIDYVEAYKWWNLSAAQGYESSVKARAIIEARMTPSQIADAQQLSREFRPRTGFGPKP